MMGTTRIYNGVSCDSVTNKLQAVSKYVSIQIQGYFKHYSSNKNKPNASINKQTLAMGGFTC